MSFHAGWWKNMTKKSNMRNTGELFIPLINYCIWYSKTKRIKDWILHKITFLIHKHCFKILISVKMSTCYVLHYLYVYLHEIFFSIFLDPSLQDSFYQIKPHVVRESLNCSHSVWQKSIKNKISKHEQRKTVFFFPFLTWVIKLKNHLNSKQDPKLLQVKK